MLQILKKIQVICFISLFLTINFYLLTVKQVFAANPNFSASSTVTYTVNSSGTTHVIFNTSLTNLTDKYYATSYKIHLGFSDIENISAYDNGGSIVPQINRTSDGIDLTIKFNNPNSGNGIVIPFSFAFDTAEVASLNGSIWEVNIPGLSNAGDFKDFTVRVVVPSYFGKPIYMKPNIGNDSLIFTKDELGTSGISLTFGDKQVFAFNLTYNLQNKQLFPVQTEIALPPNTSYQHIEIDDINPLPSNVIEDSDGNWLAQYFLKPSQILKIIAKGKAFVSLIPSREVLSKSQFNLYTKPTQYWQSNNPQIQILAQQLKTPKAIYDYVVRNLRYNFGRVSDTQNRLGAVNILNHPDQAVCLEFTDLFIALVRAAGIPSRELDGYGYTQNTSERPQSLNAQKEILHAWPEYYNAGAQKWVMVDPTWGNTTGGVDYFYTFDFDHLTFVVKGINSTYPVPAGGYKISGHEGEKDVNISFAPQSVEPIPSVSSTIDSPLEFLPLFPMKSQFSIYNSGSVLFPEQLLAANSTFGQNQSYLVNQIPPFGKEIIKLNFGDAPFLTNSTNQITIRFAGNTIAKSVKITLFSKVVLFFGGTILAGIFCIFIFIITRRTRHISISQ